MAAIPKTAKQWKEMRDFFARDIAQASIALSQVVKERNMRMMGAWGKDDTERMIHVILLSHQVVNICEAFLWSYYMPLFARYWILRMRFEENDNDGKIRKLTEKLQKFRGPYSLYKVVHEAGMTIFDMKFDQYHTVATQLGIEREEDEEEKDTGITWSAISPERLEAKLKSQQIAKHSFSDKMFESNKKSEFPDFETAVTLARELLGTLTEYKFQVPGNENAEITVPVAPKKPATDKKTDKKPERVEEVLTPDDSSSGEPDTGHS